jgi:hypothetical protein
MWIAINCLTQRLFVTVHTQLHSPAVLTRPQAVYNHIKREAYSSVHDIKNFYIVFCHSFRIRMLYSSSSTGTTAHCGLWPVEQYPSIFSCH